MKLLPLLLIFCFICTGAAGDAQPLRVGSKKFTESVILGELVTQLAAAQGTAALHRQQLGGTRVLWNALRAGEIDIYPEYTGTLIQEILAKKNLTGADDLPPELIEAGLRMSQPLGFNNTYALGMKKSFARDLKIQTISDLVKHPELRFGFTNEFMDRGDGWPSLRRHYRLPQRQVRGLDHDLAYQGLAAGDIQVIDLYSTDAEIAYYDLLVLEDDYHFFSDYQAVLLYRTELVKRNPGTLQAVLQLEGRINAAQMRRMNAEVKIAGRSEREVAAEFLQQEFNLIPKFREETFWDRFLSRSGEHLLLVLISLTAAVAISLPLGIAAFRFPRPGQLILGTAGIIQTIPSLALLVFMIPLLGIGSRPAIVALFLYSLLPIIRNTHAGLKDIPPSLRESAAALGLPPAIRLWRIELPLASRAILAGIKTSAVINIGTATLGALIGAGGYGQPILTGIRLDNLTLILEGAVPAALLALLAQALFELLERWLVPRGLRLQAAG